MAGQSLGLIETVGLGVAIEAADAAMKSANVDLVGYELTKGGGLVTVKLAGDVGAINAAVSAGVAAANRVGSVYAWKVIARTAQGINALIASQETTGLAPRPPLPEEKVAKKSQNKETVIPVANLEPLESSSDCMALSDETLFATAASQRATESAVISKDELPVKNAEIAEKAPHNNATAPLSTEVNKPLKPRHKGLKR